MNIYIERLPYILAVVAAFAVGAFLYSKLVFESAWKKAGNLSDAAMQKDMPKKLLISLVLRLVQIFVLIQMFMMPNEMLNNPDVVYDLNIENITWFAFWAWIWFSLVAHIQENIRKEDINRKLIFINSFSTLAMLIIGGVAYVWLAGIM